MANILRPAFWVPRPSDDFPYPAWPIQYNLSLYGPGQFKCQINVNFNAGKFFYESAPWQWQAPYNLALLGPLGFRPQVTVNFRPLQYFYESSPWQWQKPYNLALLGPKVFQPPVFNHFFYHNYESPVWQWQQPWPTALYLAKPLPSNQFFPYFYESAPWQWKAPYNLPLLIPPVLTPPGVLGFVRDRWDRDAWGNFIPGAGIRQAVTTSTKPPANITDQTRPWKVPN